MKIWEGGEWAGSLGQAGSPALASPGGGLSLSLRPGSVQAAADHRGHGVLGSGKGTGLVGIITHHLTSFQWASAPRPPAEGTGSQSLVMDSISGGTLKPGHVTQLENLTLQSWLLDQVYPTDVVVNPSMPLKAVRQRLPASRIPTASAQVLCWIWPSPAHRHLRSDWKPLPKYQSLRKPKGNLSYNINRRGKKRILETVSQIKTNKICPLLSPFLSPKVPHTSPKAAEMK